MEKQELPEFDDLESRLRFDYQVVTAMRTPLMMAEAYRNDDDLMERRNPILSVDEGHLATYYRVEFNVTTLAGRGRYSKKTTVMFDLLGNNDYPDSEPICVVISEPIPWSPHFHPKSGEVCLGKIWPESDGNMLLGELMIHIARLLNFDEPEYEQPNYGGWNSEAVDYWVNERDRKPIEKLHYPILPELVYLDPEQAAGSTEASPTQSKIALRREAAPPAIAPAASPAIMLRPTGPVEGAQQRIKLRPQGE
jgi:hypothetical protein